MLTYLFIYLGRSAAAKR